MAIRIANLRLGLDEPETALQAHLARVLGLRPDELGPWRILRKSLDARKKEDLHFVYTAEVSMPADEERLFHLARKKASPALHIDRQEQTAYRFPEPGGKLLEHRPIIVGSGPAGLVAGYFLAQQGYMPLILERGPAVHQRRPRRASVRCRRAVQSGEQLSLRRRRGRHLQRRQTHLPGSGPEVRRVLELLAESKGKPSIVYDYRPHLGSNRLPAVVKALRRRIEALGGEIRFNCRTEDLDLASVGASARRVQGVVTSSGSIPAQVVLLAIGHSARDTLSMLVRRGVPMTPKPFQMGVRIEQPQEIVNRVKYGPARLEEKLGAADYSLVAHGPNDLFSFCMCAGGHIIPSVSEPGFFCTNGMSLSRRDSPFANSGLVVTLPTASFPGSDVLAGVRLQQEYEGRAFALGRGEYLCPIQTARDFLAERTTDHLPPCSYPRGLVLAAIADIVPPLITEALRHGLPVLDRRWQGRFLTQATLVGPEARGSSPIRMTRDDRTRQSPSLIGLYPIGEGAGYAGGIVSAAVDGLRTAAAIVKEYAPLKSEPRP